MPPDGLAEPLVLWPSPAWLTQYHRTQHALQSPIVMARLAAEVRALDPLAPPTARVVLGHARLTRASRVGVFAGSFNPLTRAHVALAHAARAQYALDALVWLCATHTVDKERVERATWPDRLAQLAVHARAHPPEVVALTNRGLYVEEAQALRRCLRSDAQVFLLLGFDKIVQILDPRYYPDRDAALRELLRIAHLLVAPRMAGGTAEIEVLFARPENRPYAAGVDVIAMPPSYSNYSSTFARVLARHPAVHRARLRDLLPPEGLALAVGTAAYAEEGTALGQRYALRACWLAALAALDPPRLHHLPPLDICVTRSLRPDAQGQALRAWLDQAQTGMPPAFPGSHEPPPSAERA